MKGAGRSYTLDCLLGHVPIVVWYNQRLTILYALKRGNEISWIKSLIVGARRRASHLFIVFRIDLYRTSVVSPNLS
jgi:hypothetical protein